MTDDADALVAFVRESFDISNVSVAFAPGDHTDTSTDGDVDHANYDNGPVYPSAVAVSEDPVVPGGGPMDVTAMGGSGGGGIQDVVVSILMDCWGGTHETAAEMNWSTSPDVVAKEIAHEVHRVCFEADPADAPSGYELINAAPPRSAHDTQATPTVRRYQTVCYLKRTIGL
jgi:hypothetical protein